MYLVDWRNMYISLIPQRYIYISTTNRVLECYVDIGLVYLPTPPPRASLYKTMTNQNESTILMFFPTPPSLRQSETSFLKRGFLGGLALPCLGCVHNFLSRSASVRWLASMLGSRMGWFPASILLRISSFFKQLQQRVYFPCKSKTTSCVFECLKMV